MYKPSDPESSTQKESGSTSHYMTIQTECLLHAKLIDAATKGDLEKFEKIYDVLKQDQTKALEILNRRDATNDWAAIHYATQYKKHALMRRIKNIPGGKYAAKEWKILPIHLAAKNGDCEALKILLTRNPDHQEKKNGYTALHFAAQGDFYECVKLLLSNCANPGVKTNDGRDAFEMSHPTGEVHTLFSKIKPSVQIMLEAIQLPFFEKSYLASIESLAKWRRYGKGWGQFKKTLQDGFDQDEPAKTIIRNFCQGILKNPDRNEQFLYCLCALGYEDIVDFLLRNGIDFTSSTYTGKDIGKHYLGLYTAIDYGQPNIAEVLLSTPGYVAKYLKPKITPHDETTKESMTPLIYAQKKLAACTDGDLKEDLSIMITLMEKKLGMATDQTSLPAPKAISEAHTKEPYKHRDKKARHTPSQPYKFNPTITPNALKYCGTIFSKKNDLSPVKDISHQSSITASTDVTMMELESATETALDQEEEKILDHSLREIGIWGEAACFYQLEQKYRNKYNIISSASSENKLTLHANDKGKNESKKGQKITIKITWFNKPDWEIWLKERETSPDKSFEDPAHHSYDLKVKKTIEDNKPTMQYIEVKSTPNASQGAIVFTKNEIKFMRKHTENYRLYRCYNAGFPTTKFSIFKDVYKKCMDTNGIIEQIKFKM